MILSVLQIPAPLLKARAHLIEADAQGLQPFIDDMVETMYHHPRCVGLAAPQVGKPWRVIVVDASRIDKPGTRHGRVILLNPWIARQEGRARELDDVPVGEEAVQEPLHVPGTQGASQVEEDDGGVAHTVLEKGVLAASFLR